MGEVNGQAEVGAAAATRAGVATNRRRAEAVVDTTSEAGEDAVWSTTRQGVFFDQLAMTGQVPEAAAAAGVTTQDAYSKLRRNARFGERWRRAIDVGYDRLEAALLRQALGEPGAKVDVATALLLLERRRGGARAVAVTPVRGPADGGRVRAERELLRRLKAVAKSAAVPESA